MIIEFNCNKDKSISNSYKTYHCHAYFYNKHFKSSIYHTCKLKKRLRFTYFYNIILTGQYVTLEILKSMNNGDKINITCVITKNGTFDIPTDIIQLGPLSNIKKFETKIYFKAQK